MSTTIIFVDVCLAMCSVSNLNTRISVSLKKGKSLASLAERLGEIARLAIEKLSMSGNEEASSSHRGADKFLSEIAAHKEACLVVQICVFRDTPVYH